jgi:hypothetical protein
MRKPARRNYDSDQLTDLEPLHELVDAIVERHKALLPAGLGPLLEIWRDQLASVIEARDNRDAERETADAAAGPQA